jgi:diguanylate cyclase (GGDEF)-like protein
MVNPLAPFPVARHGSGRGKPLVPRKIAVSSRRTRLSVLSPPAKKAAGGKSVSKALSKVLAVKVRGPDKTAKIGANKAQTTKAQAKTRDTAVIIEALTRRLARARRQIAELEAHADTDALLDIPNRRGFERELKRSLAYLRRYKASAALLVADVDGLKPVNDTLGHAAGDHMLKAIVGVLSASIRQSDMLARLGGDEFAMLLWNLSEHDAHAKAAALEQAVDNAVCEYRGRNVPLGVSLGVTMLDASDEAAAVLERADEAMYARKETRGGKRRKVVRSTALRSRARRPKTV